MRISHAEGFTVKVCGKCYREGAARGETDEAL